MRWREGYGRCICQFLSVAKEKKGECRTSLADFAVMGADTIMGTVMIPASLARLGLLMGVSTERCDRVMVSCDPSVLALACQRVKWDSAFLSAVTAIKDSTH